MLVVGSCAAHSPTSALAFNYIEGPLLEQPVLEMRSCSWGIVRTHHAMEKK